MKHEEFKLQKAVCLWLSYQYPETLFLSDTVANMKLTPQAQLRNKAIQKSGYSFPDLIIFEPRNGFHGLFLELKIESPFKKGSECTVLKKNPHIETQHFTIEELKKRGYWGYFTWSFEMAKDMIDNYLK